MKMQKSIFAVCAFSLLAGPIPAASMASDQGPDMSRRLPVKDELCKIYGNEQEYDGQFTFRNVVPPPPPHVMPPPLSAPPPSPPPPPPPPPAAANTSTTNEIVVTGTSAPQQVNSSPVPVTVVTADTLRRVPGVQVSQTNRKNPANVPSGYYNPAQPENREKYEGEDIAWIQRVANTPVSTFAVDVDTGAYANVRRFLNQAQMPPAEAVRTEEMVNYFRYDYPLPKDKEQPFSITTDMAMSPWNKDSRLLRVGLRGYDLDYQERPAANLVFLVDVSGSMSSHDKLPLVKASLSMLADNIRPQDRVSIVVYAGAAGLKLSPCNKPEIIKAALDQLNSGGSTAGGEGLKLAYATAQENFKKGSVNRILVATDGDFNVGISDPDELKKYVSRQRENGVTLTTLGFGQGNYNEALMEQIANVGNGNYAYIDSAMEARKVLDEEMASTLFTIAKDVKIQVEFNPAYVSEYRLIGYENRLLAEEDFDNDKIDAGDIGASHQVTAIYEIVPTGAKGWLPDRRYDSNKVTGKAEKNGEAAYIKLRYKLPDGDVSRLIERPLSASMIAKAEQPAGDMAFATAVAAFGQKLRGDKYLASYGYNDIRSLAGEPKGFWRQEFVKLTELATSKN
jgi:Ca-activated chloride channel homolog